MTEGVSKKVICLAIILAIIGKILKIELIFF